MARPEHRWWIGRSTRAAALSICSWALVACPRPQNDPSEGATRLRVEGGADDARRFDAPPLEEPVPIDPERPAAEFLKAVEAVLQPMWQGFLEDCRLRLAPTHELNQSHLSAVVELSLSTSGEVMSVRIAQGSGLETFDEVALDIAREAVGLPGAPLEWISDDERVHLSWRFSRDRRQAGAATAELLRKVLPLEQVVPRLVEGKQFGVAAGRLALAGSSPGSVALFQTVAIATLGALLDSDDPVVVALAIDAVGEVGVDPLEDRVRSLADSMQSVIREAAVRALGQLGDASSVAKLESLALQTKNPRLSAAAASALRELGKSAEIAQRALDDLARRQNLSAALAVLTEVRASGTLAPLIALASQEGNDVRPQRIAAATALGFQAKGSSSAQKALLECLDAADAGVKAACAAGWSMAAEQGVRHRPAYWKLAPLLRHPDERVRAQAIAAAAALEPARFAKELEGLRATSEPVLQQTLARVLGPISGGAAFARLAELAVAKDASVRAAAARSLRARSEAPARALLEKLAADADPVVRAACIGPESSPEALAGLLADPSAEVRTAALRQLVALRGRDATMVQSAEQLAAANSDVESLGVVRAWLAGR